MRFWSARALIRLMAAACLVLLLAGPMAANEHECQLTVEPAAAMAGSQFMLGGSGYSPTELVLQKSGAEPVTVGLDLAGQDPFEIPISSEPGDEGRWTATVTDPDAGCSASVQFRVTLLDTAAVADTGPAAVAAFAAPTAAVVYLLVIAAGFGGGLVVALFQRRSIRA